MSDDRPDLAPLLDHLPRKDQALLAVNLDLAAAATSHDRVIESVPACKTGAGKQLPGFKLGHRPFTTLGLSLADHQEQQRRPGR